MDPYMDQSESNRRRVLNTRRGWQNAVSKSPSAGPDLKDDTDVFESADSQSLDTNANASEVVP